MPEDTPARG